MICFALGTHALTSYKSDWYKTPKGWTRKENKPQGCSKSFYSSRSLYRQVLCLKVLQMYQRINVNGLTHFHGDCDERASYNAPCYWLRWIEFGACLIWI